jgi:asparagine synthase (glutamine-hydrolysing)
MCGITGWVGFSGTVPSLGLEQLKHRGPDDQGQEVYRSQSQRVRAILGSTRLAIIDLSPAGRMPMEHPEEPLSIVFNGEVYNFQELRSELEKTGERFFSRTDTEVILRGYRVWGDEVVKRLKGMFAFALWDGRGDGRLLMARDRFGKKPLYFQEDAGKGLRFSSELKTLLASDQQREIDPISLEYYLDRGYPPSDRCMMRGYRKLLAGQMLVWERGHLRQQPYWNFPEASGESAFLSQRKAEAEMIERLTEAVRKRLIADVPIGMLLSGGVDSSSLLALMSKFFQNPITTYTACFGSTNLDESEKARKTAILMGSQHHAILISPRAGRLLPFVASHLDEPIADPSAIATYLICRKAREKVTVLLTGDGSDELLLGYPRYRLHAAAHLMSHFLPAGLRKVGSRFLPQGSIIERTLSAPDDPLLRDRYWLDHRKIRTAAFSRSKHLLPRNASLRLILNQDIQTWLVEDVLMKVDKMSMATSVEIRVPFLDQDLAEWILGLPVAVRMSWRRGKKILSGAMRNLVPQHISWSKKQPFQVPIDDWLRSEWRILAKDVLLDTTTRRRGWTDEREVGAMLARHCDGEASYGRRLYQLLILELWARSILDKGEAEPIPTSTEDCARNLITDRPVQRIAVIAPAGIGDTMRLTPGLRSLGEADPNVSVTIYVDRGRSTDEVMAGERPVDRHILMDFHGKMISKIIQLVSGIRRNAPDQLVSTWFSKLSPFVHLLCGVKNQSGWVPPWSLTAKVNKWLWENYETYGASQKNPGRYDALAFAKILGTDSLTSIAPFFARPIWREKGLEEAQQKLMTLRHPILAVNAVAQPSIIQRQYPLDFMAKALDELLEKGIVSSLLFLGDEHAREYHWHLVNLSRPRALDLAGELSLTATAAIMKECDAVLSIDGGLLHVALASDLPVVAIYGPTEIYSSDPRGESGRYLKVSAFDDCRCLCLNHRGIRVRAECHEQAQCLASIDPGIIVDAIATLIAASITTESQGQSRQNASLELRSP